MSISHRYPLLFACALLALSGRSVRAAGVAGEGRVTEDETTAAAQKDVANEPSGIDFDNDLQPIFTRFGCTSGPCHGKARGQGGFQLSLLGFDSDFDYDAIVKEGRGRRLFPAVPRRSLLLTKPSGLVPHGGGRRFAPDGPEFQTILNWIRSGAPRRIDGTPKLTGISVSPPSVVLKPRAEQRLIVTARYSDGSKKDVTRLAAFQSNEAPIAAVTEAGQVTAGSITGEAAIMARFMGQIAVCEVTIPRQQTVEGAVYAALPRQNFVDELVWDKLQRLNITPSGVCDDATFLRRATTDICGRLPHADEVRKFLADESDDKRSRLVDRLVQEPDFADHWANKWMDLLRPNPYRVGIKTVLNYDQWIRQRFHQRMPWDQFVTELVTARGGTWRNGAVTLFRDRRTPDEVTTLVSQLFLGIRLDCAKCHHHPFEKWGQDDFYSFAAYFAKIGRKGRGVSPPISGSEEFVYAGTKGSVTHPATGEVMTPRPLYGEAPVTSDDTDPRDVLAKWMTSGDNTYFAQVMANRVWADLMSRGLVEPVDDLRATNPPSNAALLAALGEHFAEHDYSLTELVRVIAKSHVYQLSSLPNDTNTADTRNYSRHYRHRLRAEVLRDGFTYVSGVEPAFDAMPPGTSARQIWTHRTQSYFLDAFGRPDPNQDPPCERTRDSTVVQSLHLMNSQQLHSELLSKDGRVSQLVSHFKDAGQLADEVYHLVYARPPSAEERVLVRSVVEENPQQLSEAVQDLVWAMVNSPEFVFQN
ncbi:MAG: DUF1549 and DUF1553 domain-containing protein [Planctomycetaceae bacterium]|nr:DUF1549 and DUF1553 domain-containing protein [Planctomycetaceae bacterium]